MKCHTIYFKHVFAAKGTIYYVAIATVTRINMQNLSSSIHFLAFFFSDGRTWKRLTNARRTWLFTAIKTNLNTIEGTWSDPSIAEAFEPTKNKFIAMA